MAELTASGIAELILNALRVRRVGARVSARSRCRSSLSALGRKPCVFSVSAIQARFSSPGMRKWWCGEAIKVGRDDLP